MTFRMPMTRPWTEEEVNRLMHFARSGTTPLRAAAALKRSLTSVKNRARLVGTPFLTENEMKKVRAAKYTAAVSNQSDHGMPS